MPRRFQMFEPKGEWYETQNQNEGRKTGCQSQPHRSLTLPGHVPVSRSEDIPRRFQTSEPKGESYETEDQNQGRKTG
jgi:hypothetical protein